MGKDFQRERKVCADGFADASTDLTPNYGENHWKISGIRILVGFPNENPCRGKAVEAPSLFLYWDTFTCRKP